MQACRNAVKCGNAAALGARARLLACVATAAALLIAASFTARADEDLPGRVGRIAEFSGQLYLSPEDRATEWQPIGSTIPSHPATTFGRAAMVAPRWITVVASSALRATRTCMCRDSTRTASRFSSRRAA